jgi:OOP family OmpA-OmpF porin
MNRYLALAVAASLVPLSALAAPGWYAGAAGGASRTDSNLARNREAALSNVTEVHSRFDGDDTAWRAFAGYSFNDSLAIEVSYADLGRQRIDAATLGGTPQLPGAYSIDRRVRGFGADVVGTLPLSPRFALLGRAGLFRAHTRSDVSLSGNIAFAEGNADDRARRLESDDTVAHFGVGAQWSFSERVQVRLEWEHYLGPGTSFQRGQSSNTGSANTDLFMLGAVFRF